MTQHARILSPSHWLAVAAQLALSVACRDADESARSRATTLPQTAEVGRDDATGELRLFYFDALGGRLLSADGEGKSARVLATGRRGSIRRAPLALAAGQTAEGRTDVEVLFDGLPEPIDLALDLEERRIYWSDRGDNTINRAALELPMEQSARTRTDRQVLVRGLNEAIGIGLDRVGRSLYYTDLGGSVGTARLDGSGARTLLRSQGALTGIAVVRLAR